MVDDLVDEYAKQKTYVEEKKPYWLTFRHPRNGEMHYELWNYFPGGHYELAIDAALDLHTMQLAQEEIDHNEDHDLLPDGGRYTDTAYAWFDPDTGGLLYHTEANSEFADPFFEEEESARDFLERQADLNGNESYENLSLQKFKAKKIGEAVEILTDQSGLADF